MEFTGNIDNSEIRDLVQDQIDNIDFDSMIDDRTDDILAGKDLPDMTDMEREVQASISDYECEMSGRLDDLECALETQRERNADLEKRVEALENLVAIGAKMLRLMQAFACTPEVSDAPEA